MLILTIGDLHIPDRAIDLPDKFKKLLAPNKISQILLLGNSTQSPSTIEFLKSLTTDLQIVKGEYDQGNFPLTSVVQHGSLKIGFTNGYTTVPRGDPLSLLGLARQLDVDVLLWGGTHRVEAYTLEGKFFVNPGSATGAFTTDWPEVEETEVAEEKLETDTKQNSNAEQEESENDKDGERKEKAQASAVSENDDDDNTTEEYDMIPSFCLLDVQGTSCTLYIYTYIDDEVKVDKVTYKKEN